MKTDIEKRDAIWRCTWEAYGHAPDDGSYTYWLGKYPELDARGVEIGVPDYAERRMHGWEAESGPDHALYGEFAVPPSPYHAVPPSPWDPVVVVDPPKPVDPPAPAQPPEYFAALVAKIDALAAQSDRNTEKIQQQINQVVKDAEKSAAAILPLLKGGSVLGKLLG